jgi:hypothetical protein
VFQGLRTSLASAAQNEPRDFAPPCWTNTMRKFTNQIAALCIVQGLFMVSTLFDRRL